MSTFERLEVSVADGVGTITLNRPKVLNALSEALMVDLTAAVDDLEADDAVGCIVVTGSEKAFAAGADIKEMAAKDFASVYRERLPLYQSQADITVAGDDLSAQAIVRSLCRQLQD